MKEKTQKILNIWYKHFMDEDRQYSEFEDSDIEYFVGCMLYNHFNFSYALNTMKTIDLSYDFLSSCGDEYDEIVKIIKSIEIEDEEQKIVFLKEYIKESQEKYSGDALYLLNRLAYHVDGVSQRFLAGHKAKAVQFINPILR
ncbi:hypothetical protein M947_01525 [Sulfurimonas hongkongensis]|uniref:Uncharacterized protein n=1 Tax=Sulfurimonas hongkongensis TaxID=1172190 RepID=T0JQQ8_9BACT|nr:hypothetical protein [Sulfurimonas hongkongensis]EQB40506.1 hypothetical protein M947_01525 [Sulfurimonas hongkongensis]